MSTEGNQNELTPRDIERELYHRRGDLQRARVRAENSNDSERVKKVDDELARIAGELIEVQKKIN